MKQFIGKDVNNQVYICGEIVTEFEFSHQHFDEVFYKCKVKILRLSGAADILPVTISERLLPWELTKGKMLCAVGQLRSNNRLIDGRSRLFLSIFVKEVLQEPTVPNANQIVFFGHLCKLPIYRVTPFGREITDLMIAVNREHKKSDYLPSIAWGRNALFSKELSVGDRIAAFGRIQSREYEKPLPDGGGKATFTAYEVSISRLNAVGDCDETTQELYAHMGIEEFPQ